MNKGIMQKYRQEITGIKYIIEKLKNDKVYDPQRGKNSKSDGSLSKNAEELEEKFIALLDKIDNNKKSIQEEAKEEYSKFNK